MTREEVKTLIQQGTEELNEALQQGRSDSLERYLDVLSRFHHYSFRNAMLIAMQRPDATYVAGFHAWRRLGRKVLKGETGIGIIAPMIYRKETEGSDEDDSIRGFKVVHVFDVSQTEGDELPDLGKITGDPSEHTESLEASIREHRIELRYEHIAGGADGLSANGRIVINPDLTPAETFAVLVHEFAHEILHTQPERRQATNRTIRETEAEAVAHVVCRAIGMDCSTRSVDYIQLYRGDHKTLGESLEHIQKAAAVILDGITGDSRSIPKAA